MAGKLASSGLAGKTHHVTSRELYLDCLGNLVYTYQDSLGNDGMTTVSKERLHGTLDALVLKTLSSGPLHGYAIARWLEEATGDAIQVEEGSLYPSLHRMEKHGWRSEEHMSELQSHSFIS